MWIWEETRRTWEGVGWEARERERIGRRSSRGRLRSGLEFDIILFGVERGESTGAI